MLASTHRFHGRTSLLHVYRHGTMVRGQHMGLRIAYNRAGTTYRVAVIVSRKIHKSAVRRNRLRRRIYEAVRTGPAIAEPLDIVVMVFSDQASQLTPAELKATLQNLGARAKIYQKTKQPTSQAHAIVRPGKGE